MMTLSEWFCELVNRPVLLWSIRIALMGVGMGLVVGPVIWCGVRRCASRVLLSDLAALRLMAVLLIVLPIACWTLYVTAGCDCVGSSMDFPQLSFQHASSTVIVVFGSHIAFRARRKRYILLFLLEFLFVAAVCPPA